MVKRIASELSCNLLVFQKESEHIEVEIWDLKKKKKGGFKS